MDTEKMDKDGDLFAGGDPIEGLELSSPEDRGDAVAEPEPTAEVAADDTVAKEEATEEEEVAAELGAAEPAPEPEPEPEPEESAPQSVVPRGRFDAELAKRKALEARLSEVEKQTAIQKQAEEQQYDFGAKEAEYMDAVLDGDKEKAMGIRNEIRQAESSMYQAQASQAQDAAVTQTREQLEFDNAIQNAITQHPELDTENEGYSEELLSMTNTMFAGYIQQGYRRADAMNLAVNQIMGMRASPALGEQAPQPQPTPVPGTTQTQVAQKVAQAAQQPPATQNVAESNAVGSADMLPDISRMSDDELLSWQEKNPTQWAELRGDFG